MGCPGCPKCLQHHGYTFHLSAGRPTRAHEYVFLLSKSAAYYYDAAAIAELFADARAGNPGSYRWAYGAGTGKGRGAKSLLKKDGRVEGWNTDGARKTRNARSVWTIATKPYAGAHFATFPEELVCRCILAGSRPGDLVLDPFAGTGTVPLIAVKLGRRGIGVELNPKYVHEQARARLGLWPLLGAGAPGAKSKKYLLTTWRRRRKIRGARSGQARPVKDLQGVVS